jgi:transcriptional regulator with XRE-family HTH domain
MTGVGDWQTMFGQTVRGRRQELGLTLDEASAAIGISRSHLNLIELGKATGISRDCAAKIDAGLGFELALLALLPASSTDADSTAHDGSEREMRRAEFNKAMLAIGASLLLDIDAERLFGTQSVDEALLEDLESLTADFAERQHHARPQTILGPVRAHLRHLLDLEGVSAAPDLRPRLARVTAETATLAGWVSFRGQGDLVAAHGHLALGRRHARAAGDDELTAQVIGLSSSLYSSLDIPQGDKDQRPSLALNLLRAAQRKAGNNGSLSLQGWLAARVAGEHALLGEGRKARAALRERRPPCRAARLIRLACLSYGTRHESRATPVRRSCCFATPLQRNSLNRRFRRRVRHIPGLDSWSTSPSRVCMTGRPIRR